MTKQRIMYVCSECAEGCPEACGHYDRTELRVMPDGAWLCESCFDNNDDNEFLSWGHLPAPAEIDAIARRFETADDSVVVKVPLGALRQLARSYPELNRIINDPAFERPEWECAARKQGTTGGLAPADCDWPGCGCDPAANKVLQALDESGFEITKKPTPLPWDHPTVRSYEPVEALAAEIYDGFVYDGPAGTNQEPRWTPGGNGTKQDEARDRARRSLREAGHSPALTRHDRGSVAE
ncbi:hypothetical protein [Bradyrhizobium elkanii]|uniref:hypothetical protein n=1 Tax=Bradyrhizobium elkanii TaxID=29448 RepID=UPI003D20097D